MFINLKTLLHLPVVTESGVQLGKIKDCELDIDSHHVRHYTIESGFFSDVYYLITPAQIKSITAEKIVVDDAVSKFEKGGEKQEKPSRAALGGAVSISKDL